MADFLHRLAARGAHLLRKRGDRLADALRRRRLRNAGADKAQRIATHMSAEELAALHALALELPPGARALEIGSYLGASTAYLGAALAERGGRLYCCDTWQNETMSEGSRDTFELFRANTAGLRCELVTIRKRSEDLLPTDVEMPLHLIFIDGDHGYDAVRGDFHRAVPWLAPDGVIVLHDFSHRYFPGVTRVVGEALASGDWVQQGLVDSLVWLRRASWMTPPWTTGSRH